MGTLSGWPMIMRLTQPAELSISRDSCWWSSGSSLARIDG